MSRIIRLTLWLVCLYSPAHARIPIIPQPVIIREDTKGSCRIRAGTPLLLSDASLQPAADFLNSYLRHYYGFRLAAGGRSASATIYLQLDKAQPAVRGAYRLQSGSNGIFIKSSNPEGVFYGVQSLIQLLPVPDTGRQYGKAGASCQVPSVFIQDEPRFAWRGMHLDVARHFFPVAFIKEYIDYLALHKMNYFHWHLTDDQGWRIGIKKYPRLTGTGAMRAGTITGRYPGAGNDHTPYGGFYTQKEIREVVAYAARRYITIVPEIEMPGHASAAIAAYPELSCYPDSPTVMPGPVSGMPIGQGRKKVQETWGVFEDVFCPTEYTFRFLEDVLDEVMALFPSRYIHIGGDECPKEAWKGSAFCRSLLKEKGLKDEHALQSYFIGRIEKYLNGKGRSVIGWDEILEGGLAPNATVMSWRGEEGGIEAARQGHDVVMTPGDYCYFDHSQAKADDSLTIGGYTTVQQVYSYEPVPKGLEPDSARHVLGAQANLWTEYITNPSKVQYQLFPRMSALSEVLWSPAAGRNWPAFEPRLRMQFRRYRLWGVRCSDAAFDPGK